MKKLFAVLFAVSLIVGFTGMSMACPFVNSVGSSVSGKAEYEIADNYGNPGTGGSALAGGTGTYSGKVHDEGRDAAENEICGEAKANGNFTYYSGKKYNPVDCPNCNISLGNYDVNVSMKGHTDSSAKLTGDGTLEKGKLKATGKLKTNTWATSNDYSGWADGGQSLNASYRVNNNDPSLGDRVWGKIDSNGGTSATSGHMFGPGSREAFAGSRTGNDMSIYANGGDKFYDVHGSGSVAGAAGVNAPPGQGYASGEYTAGFDYKLKSDYGYGWKANGCAGGNTNSSVAWSPSSMSASSYTTSGAHSCPTAQ